MRCLLVALLVPANAFADRVDPFHPPAVDPDPQLVDTGVVIAVEPGAEVIHTGLATAFGLEETAAIGAILTASPQRAIALELVESLHLAVDDRTPTLGLLGVAVHHLGRLGPAFDTAQLGVGAALSLGGSSTRVGVGATARLGVLDHCGLGAALHVDALLFDSFGPDYALLIGATFAWLPLTHFSAAAPRPAAPPPRTLATSPAGPACANAEAITAALVRHRRAAVDACNAGRADCRREHDRVVVLSADLGRCRAGEPVEVPGD